MELEKVIFTEATQPGVRDALQRVHDGLHNMHFAWSLNYDAAAALHNIEMFERGAKHFGFAFPVRVFLSNWTDGILSGSVPLEAVRDPHIQEWYVTFYEVPVEEAKTRLTQYPRFPYDGRNADLVRAEMLASGTIQQLLKKSAKALRERGIPQWNGS